MSAISQKGLAGSADLSGEYVPSDAGRELAAMIAEALGQTETAMEIRADLDPLKVLARSFESSPIRLNTESLTPERLSELAGVLDTDVDDNDDFSYPIRLSQLASKAFANPLRSTPDVSIGFKDPSDVARKIAAVRRTEVYNLLKKYGSRSAVGGTPSARVFPKAVIKGFK